ncbi:MAG: hypothetical protein AAF266_11320, partial [Planctomycetota bacterium]
HSQPQSGMPSAIAPPALPFGSGLILRLAFLAHPRRGLVEDESLRSKEKTPAPGNAEAGVS